MKILIIEDNHILWRNLIRYLISRDIFADLSIEWEDWLNKALINYYDIIILDLNLPKINWIDICKKIREWKIKVIQLLKKII